MLISRRGRFWFSLVLFVGGVGKRPLPGEPIMKPNTQRQAGFTLVELLVVITIIGMLMALLLPAVNAAVEQARNLTCKNNMKNIAIGCISFESNSRRFPGYSERAHGTSDASGDNFIDGWTVAILPQLDHHDWYDELMRRDDSNPQGKFSPASELFVCPSNPPTTGLAGWSAFCINAGYWDPSGVDGRPQVTDDNPDGLEWPADGIAHAAARVKGVGVNQISLMVATTMDYISASDGSSYTVILSENVNQTTLADRSWLNPGKLGTTMVWHKPPSTDDSDSTVNPLWLINGRDDETSLLSVPLNADTARPSSFHTGGVNMAFCDQRVIFVRETITYRVYQHLLTPNGRESHMRKNSDGSFDPLSDQQYQ
jgi:prepilin-type N-terminal cleavage/methylation domain-containing protein/prepilin-type processing-associated H-X9-DG protein